MNTKLFLAILITTIALPAFAADFGIRAGRYLDTEETFAGIELAVPLSERVVFDPNVEYVFFDGATLLTANADFHFLFSRGRAVPWVGAGAALIYTAIDDGGDSTTRAGLNLLAGLGVRAGSLMPYLQVKWVRASEEREELVAAAGLRF